MYAVVDLQGHQYIVTEKDEIVVDNVDKASGETLSVDKVLALFDADGNTVKLWSPYVSGAQVEFEVWMTQKWEKVKILKFKRKTRYSRTRGFRPLQTVLTVKKISG